MNLLREPDAGNPHVRFDERDVETEHGSAREAPATERAGKQIGRSYPTAPRLDVINVGPDAFYRNPGDGTFVDSTALAGFSGDSWSSAVP